jgi:hypothetical protein
MGRTVSLGLLERVHIASPCTAPWDQMQGDDRVRYCGQCRLNVYNLSAMTRAEAEALIIEKQGRLCGGFYRRSDGTILTRDCPVGLRALRWRAAKAWGRLAAALAMMIGGSLAMGERRGWWTPRVRQLEPFASVVEFLTPAPPPLPVPGGLMVLGEMSPPVMGKVGPAPIAPAPDAAELQP